MGPFSFFLLVIATFTLSSVKDFTTVPAITALGAYKRDVKISNYQLSDTQQANAGLSYDLLKKVLPGLTASGSADYKKAMTVEITVEGMVGEVIDDAVADKIVALFETSMKPKPGSRYFPGARDGESRRCQLQAETK
jgi:hypothetical protein